MLYTVKPEGLTFRDDEHNKVVTIQNNDQRPLSKLPYHIQDEVVIGIKRWCILRNQPFDLDYLYKQSLSRIFDDDRDAKLVCMYIGVIAPPNCYNVRKHIINTALRNSRDWWVNAAHPNENIEHVDIDNDNLLDACIFLIAKNKSAYLRFASHTTLVEAVTSCADHSEKEPIVIHFDTEDKDFEYLVAPIFDGNSSIFAYKVDVENNPAPTVTSFVTNRIDTLLGKKNNQGKPCWIREGYGTTNPPRMAVIIRCSKCGRKSTTWDRDPYEFCPHCGSSMGTR